MAEITLRSREQILGDLVRTIIANSDFTDFAPGSTMATLLEAVASVMYQNFLMVLKLLEATDLESMTGVDLDRKAGSIGLPDGIGGVGRRPASPSNGPIEIRDPRTPKKSSKLYAGKPAPYAGGTVVYVEDASSWPDPSTQPKIYIGRGTADKLEGPIKYISKIDNGVFWTLQLEGTLTKNHSISESVVLAQGGDRVIPAGTTIQTVPNASTPAVVFTTDAQAVIYDGEESTTVTCTSSQFGEAGNALAGAIKRFGTDPFPQAAVRNTTTFANGRSTENDEELRQRIRDYPATLARGTRAAITAALLGLRDPDTGKAIASVVVIEPTDPGEPSKIYINDGSLLEPTFSGQPYELFVKNASGQELFFRTTFAPITPCVAIGANKGPFSLEDGMSITLTIDGVNETLSITGTEYQNLETATALEIVRDLNGQANICSFRTIDGAKSIAAFDLSGKGEVMVVQPGVLQAILGLPTTEIKPIYLYKNGESLSFKGKTATLTTAPFPWNLTAGDLSNVIVHVDSSSQVISITDADFAEFYTNIETASLSNWISVFKKKINGVSFEIVGSRIVWSTYQKYTSDSYLEIDPKTARPGVYRAADGDIVITADDDYGLDSGTSYNQLISVFNASDSNLNGEYLAKINTVDGLTRIYIPSTITSKGNLYWMHPTNPDAGWVGIGKMWNAVESSRGAKKDFSFNRFTGEIRLTKKPEENATIEVGSLATRASIRSKTTIGGIYGVPPNLFGTARLVMSFDDHGEIKNIPFGISSKLSVSKPYPSSHKIVRITALDGVIPDSSILQSAIPGDWIYLVNYTGSGWDSVVGGLYQIKKVDELLTWIDIEVDATHYAAFDGTHDLISGSLFLFSTTSMPQVVDFGNVNTLTVDQAVEIINSQIHSGTATKLSAEQFIIRTNNYLGGAISLFAVIGNGVVLFDAESATNVQPHVASVQTSKVDGGFPVLTNILTRSEAQDGFGTRGSLIVDANFTDIIDSAPNPAIQAAPIVTNYRKGYQETFLTGRLVNFTGRIYNTSNAAPFSGLMRGEKVLRPPLPFDTPVDGGSVQNYRNLSLRMRDLSITKDDKLVVEMDLNAVEKTIIVPMHKKAVIETCSDVTGGGNAYIFDFTLQDPDDANKPFFDIYSTFRTFNLNDFRILTKSVGCYKFSGDGVALIHRSKDVEAASRLKLIIKYPSDADRSDIAVTHRTGFVNLVPESIVIAELSSGSLTPGSFLNIGTLNLTVIPSDGVALIEIAGSALDPTKYTVGNVLKIGGSHALSGAYRIVSKTGSTVTVVAPGLMRYKTITISGSTAYTTSNSDVVVVHKPDHGLISGDKVNIAASGDIDGISQSDLSVASASVTYIDDDHFSYTAYGIANAPPEDTATIQFPWYTRTLTTTPGSTEILVTETGHNMVGGEGIDIDTDGASVGGIPAANLSLTNAMVAYVNVNQYRYNATAAAPSDVGQIDVSRTHNGILISTVNGSNIVTVTHNNHKYTNGALLTFSGAVPPTGSSLSSSAFSGVKSITYLTPNSYSYVASNIETGTPSGTGSVNAVYGPFTFSAQTGDNTAIVTMSYSGHGLDEGAVIDTSAGFAIGGISAGDLTRSGVTIVRLSSSTFTFAANASSPARSATIVAADPFTGAGVRRTSRVATLAVPQLPPPGSNTVLVDCSDHRIQIGESFYIVNAPVAGIGGMSQDDLQNAGGQLTASSLLSNSFAYIAPGFGGSPSGSLDFVRMIALQASQYPLSSYTLNATKNTITNLAAKINAYGISDASVAGTTPYVVTKATYDSHAKDYNAAMEYFSDMETAYDYHGFASKYCGSAAIYDYNAAGGYVRSLVQSNDPIFPTVDESTDGTTVLYSPVGEEVFVIPSNGNTLSRWMGFSSISSLAAQATVEETDSTQRVQISSKVVGFSGAVKVKGVTANKAEMFVIGNSSAVYDPNQSVGGLLGATKVAVDAASSAFIPTGAMVNVANSLPATILRPYRYLPSGANITSANTGDITTYFRPTNYVKYVKVGAGQGRICFFRNGMGSSQSEPMTYAGTINVTFSDAGNDRVKITTNVSELSARVGDMMNVFGDIHKAVAFAEQIGGNTVRYTMGAGVKTDMWAGLDVAVTGFQTYTGFNGTFTVAAVGTHLSGTYVGRQYFEVSNSQSNYEAAVAKVTIPMTELPFAAFPKMATKTLSNGYSSAQEYMGYPVIQVNGPREIIVIAPSIAEEIASNGGDINLTLNPNLYPLHRKLMVFLPSVYNEKNIQTNRRHGSMYETPYNGGEIKVLVRKLFSNFVSIWVSNSAAEATDDMKLGNMLVNTDDWLICNNEFQLANRGMFRIVAHNGRNHFIIYNPVGGTDEYLDVASGGSTEWLIGPFTGDRPLRVLDAECVMTDDKLRISSPNSSGGSVSWFPSSLIGSFAIYTTGYSSAADVSSPETTFDTTLLCPAIDITMSSAPATIEVNGGDAFVLGANAGAISFQKATAADTWRYVAGRTIDPIDKTRGHLYLLPEVNSFQINSELGSKISCLNKLGANEGVVRGIDSYLTFAGLVREAHRVVDGNPSNIALYPGVRAAGTSIEVMTPLVKAIFVRLQIKPKDGVDSSIIGETVRATVAGYVNKLSVGRPVVLSEIIRVVQSLPGVFSVTILDTLPSAQGDRIVVGDMEKAIVFDAENDIVVS
jgi:hypothetical protein